MNMEKTEDIWIGEHVLVDGKTIKQMISLYTWAAPCVRMEEVVRKYRGEWKQEQQRGGEWKALCGTEN